jgi:hypothetical protein
MVTSFAGSEKVVPSTATSDRPGADRIAPGHQCRARRRASRLDQELRQPQPFGHQLIETRRRRTAQFTAAVGADVSIAGVIGEDEKDVGLHLLLRKCRRNSR